MKRRLYIYGWILLAALLVIAPMAPAALAQDAAATDAYPTVAALEAAVLPPRDRVDLAERLRGVKNIPPTPTTAATRQVGEHEVFTASNDNVVLSIPATLRVVGTHIYLWVEDGAKVNDTDLRGLADAFDNTVYDSVRNLWGSEANPGVDGDPHVYGLFAHNLGASTAAYFAADNTYPKAVVPTSNEHEIFFFNLDAIGENFTVEPVESIVAHEFQHMIRNNLQMNEETWLNEGLSMFTQAYLFNDLDSSILSFLYQPGDQLNDWHAEPSGRSADYGAATLFLVYFYERYGIDAMEQLSADSSPRGLQGVDDVLHAMNQPGVNKLFADWVLANALDDTTYGDGNYGYSLLSRLPEPPTVADATGYPFSYAGSVNQFATDYLTLANLSGGSTLTINVSAPEAVGLIPTEAPSGSHFWYSNRGDMSDSRLTRAFDLSGVDTATLDYKLWYDNEEDWDYGYVMVSDDNGVSWDVLPTAHTTTNDPQHIAYGAGYTGSSSGWVDESVALDAYAGEQILVRFELITDDAVNRPGMALDDVSIPEIGYSDDFEGDGGGDWSAEGWLWTDNRLPEQAWVQVVQQTGGKTVDVQRWLIDGADTHPLPLVKGADSALIAISPLAPVTTVPMPYTISVDSGVGV